VSDPDLLPWRLQFNYFLETELEKLKAAASTGYARGKLFEETKALPRDRKDWYD
jgi:hypothetical protein